MSTRIPTEVYAEMTPNPSTMKFVANRLLIEGGKQVEFTSKEQCVEASPLAAELFNFPFVQAVFVSGNYVSVAKDESLGWEMIVQQLREYIREWLAENEVAVAFVPEHLVPGPSTQETPFAESMSSSIDYSDMKPTDYDEEIRFLLDEFVRPAVEQDGGAIDFKAFHEGKVYVQMRGACSGCPSSMQTLKGGIENLLRSKIGAVKEVVAEEV
ncbi:MAG: NifU family protein [Flavobacteriales bacterium]|nr:NifU family protein [Flavobacteriales bacterium]